MSDEIPNQNVIRIYRSPADGQWRARIGPDDGRGVEQLGGTPCQALGRLIGLISGGKYAFDPSWCPHSPFSPACAELVHESVSCEGIEVTIRLWGRLFKCVPYDQVTGAETGECLPQSIDPVSARHVGQPGRPAQGQDLVGMASRTLGCDSGQWSVKSRATGRKAPGSR